MENYYLVDYKGKFTIIQDELHELDNEVGKISKSEAILQAKERRNLADYYGVPAYIGENKILKKLYK